MERRRSQVGLVELERRALLTALPTLTALSASTASAAVGQSVTFTATVTDLSPGGAIPSGGTVSFRDPGGSIGSGSLVNGVATITTSGLAVGADAVSASYGGTSGFAASATGTIVNIAGNETAGYSGNGGFAFEAELDYPFGVAVDSSGNVFIADQDNSVVREVVKATGDIKTIAGNGTQGYQGDGGPATSAELSVPYGLAIDSSGDVFISDWGNNVIREVVKSTGDIITVAGTGTAGFSGNNGPATSAELDGPGRVAVDSSGDVFISDRFNNEVREVVKSTGDIIDVAGNVAGAAGYGGDNGPATSAELDSPRGIALDSSGDLFITDCLNNVIREVVKSTGDIVTIAGDGTEGYEGDGGSATSAEIDEPDGVAVDPLGDVIILVNPDSVVREVVKATGDIITIAGTGTAGYSGNKGPATSSELDLPHGVAVDSVGDIFVADTSNNLIREFSPAVTVTIRAKQIPTINWPTPTPIVSGTALGAAQLDAVASVAGTFTYTPPAGTVLGAGAGQVLSTIFTPTDSTDYASVTATTTILVVPSPHLVLTTAPPAVVAAGSTFGLVVTADDASGQVETSYGGLVTIALAADPAGGKLGGTLSVAAINGVATFVGLTLNQDGPGYTLVATASGFSPATSGTVELNATTRSDFFSDGRDDFGVFGYQRFIIAETSTGQTIEKAFGGPEDVPVVGDFFGDGRDDFGVQGYQRYIVYNPGTGQTLTQAFGGPDDVPVVGDFFGNGHDDFAVFGYQRFIIVDPITHQTIVQPLGGPEDVPVVGDFFGDGHDDLGVYGYGRFLIFDPSTGQTITQSFGGPEDVPVVGDFFGDGHDDLGVYGYGRFIAFDPSTGKTLYQAFGGPDDVPVIGDFFGDGHDDFGVYGYDRFIVVDPSTGKTLEQAFGGPEDVPSAESAATILHGGTVRTESFDSTPLVASTESAALVSLTSTDPALRLNEQVSAAGTTPVPPASRIIQTRDAHSLIHHGAIRGRSRPNDGMSSATDHHHRAAPGFHKGLA